MCTYNRLSDLIFLTVLWKFYIKVVHLSESDIFARELGLRSVVAPHAILFTLTEKSSHRWMVTHLLRYKLELRRDKFKGFS